LEGKLNVSGYGSGPSNTLKKNPIIDYGNPSRTGSKLSACSSHSSLSNEVESQNNNYKMSRPFANLKAKHDNRVRIAADQVEVMGEGPKKKIKVDINLNNLSSTH
jgi:hypothetical protein